MAGVAWFDAYSDGTRLVRYDVDRETVACEWEITPDGIITLQGMHSR